MVPGGVTLLPDDSAYLGRPKVGPANEAHLYRSFEDPGLNASDPRPRRCGRKADGRHVHGVQQQGNARSRRDLRTRSHDGRGR